MKLTPLQRRAARRDRNHSDLDMNLVSLIDIFTILIFFLMSSTGDEVLPTARAVNLPESTADKTPRETVVVTVSGQDIVVDGRKVASVADVIDAADDLIAPLTSESFSNKAVRGTANYPLNGNPGTASAASRTLSISYDAASQSYTVTSGSETQTFGPATSTRRRAPAPRSPTSAPRAMSPIP